EDQGDQRRRGQSADDDAGHGSLQLAALADAQRHRNQAEHRRNRGHQDRAQTPYAGGHYRLTQPHAVLVDQLVGVVNQHDGVVDDDADEDDDPQETLHVEGRIGQEQRHRHADERQRDGEQDDERVTERLKLRRHHHVDQDQRQNRGEGHGLERLLLFLILTA